ncbi:tRNA (guanosine(46)-N7)-methyltransferase TrmB [Liquorilactobacillus cacaonum]|uniref:tRNA (guanine-N(7)-)-methyltransferase n=1 Tax=Liquorilactobacillus cacaonum DSM 21116 TaxID=1423729 RepID=A0A0R2CH23_9LACO|nr:tRNA (guanosine(46)-N7)-methyltransferase TrmB [Liquorilactobacillus cacaonum]KRM90602.1 tRNA (m(7)G46) methyltransferase [Liquorilactobacillus cacaonum DSM 21116]
MRLRNKPWAKPLIDGNPDLIVTNPNEYRGKWETRFKRSAPLFIEVGMGKGGFIIELARLHPENNYIGIEIQTTVAAIVLKKQIEIKLPNLQLICANGSGLSEYFEENEIDGIFLNFSDPWPKKRQEKRRLTYRTFLKQYQNVMSDEGTIEFKTDNRGLFEYSLKSMNNYGMNFEQVFLDLHKNEEAMLDNVMTEYEEKFSKKGQPIYKIVANFQKLEQV